MEMFIVGILAFIVGLMLRPECQRCGEFEEELPTQPEDPPNG